MFGIMAAIYCKEILDTNSSVTRGALWKVLHFMLHCYCLDRWRELWKLRRTMTTSDWEGFKCLLAGWLCKNHDFLESISWQHNAHFCILGNTQRLLSRCLLGPVAKIQANYQGNWFQFEKQKQKPPQSCLWKPLLCNSIQRLKRAQLIRYNIETFISCFNTQKPRFLLPSVPESSIVHSYPKTKKQNKKSHISSRVNLQASLFSMSILPFTEQCK